MKLENNWQQKSLQLLEKKDYGTPPYDSHVVTRVFQLRKIPLNQFTKEDMRLMIGQQEGLPYLIRLAIDILNDDLFAEGDFYPGDLLQNVLRVKPPFWTANKDLWQQVDNLIKNKILLIHKHKISLDSFYSGAND